MNFSGKVSARGESRQLPVFPSTSTVRATFERADTAMGPHLPAFLCWAPRYNTFPRRSAPIPAALDQENPVLRSTGAQQAGLCVLRALGDTNGVWPQQPTVGAQTNISLWTGHLFDRRLDLKVCGHASGRETAQGQSLRTTTTAASTNACANSCANWTKSCGTQQRTR